MAFKGLKVGVSSLLAAVTALSAPGAARAAVITEYTSGVTVPSALTTGPDGNVWFINGHGIARIDPAGQVTTFSAGLDAGATPLDLTAGPDGDVWFTDNGAGAVGYVTPTGTINEFTVPAGDSAGQIAAGSDGNVWFYSNAAPAKLVKMTPTGAFTGYPMPPLGEIADNMVLGPDGAIWFSDQGTASIGRITPSGIITEYPLLRPGAFPTNITVGGDGDLWFSDNSGAVGRISTAGVVQEFTTGLQVNADPDAITAGPDGNVWFTDQNAGERAIGRITASGQITEFTAGLNQNLPVDITAGADGNLWVPQASMAGPTPSSVAQISTSGQITEITKGVPVNGLGDGDSILAGSNGALWFTDGQTPAIGRIVLAPSATTGSATSVSSTGASIAGTVKPLADTTAVLIEYGTTPALGSSLAVGTLAPGMSARAVGGSLASLPPSTTIYYRIAATNSAGEADGVIQSFSTLPAVTPPAPAAPSPANQSTTGTLANQRITLTTPAIAACVASSGTLGATLASTTIANSKQPKLRFLRALFYIDRGIRHRTSRTVRRHGKRVKVVVTTYRANARVTKLPASSVLKLAGLHPGVHNLRATLFFSKPVPHHRRRKTVTKSLTAKFSVC